MKNFVYALSAQSLTAGVAMAAVNGTNERPYSSSSVEKVAETVQVPARTVMTSTELARANLSGDEMLTVTKISGDSQIAEMNSDR